MGRTFLLFVCAILLVLCITSYAYADLIDNGDGTITQTRSDGTKLMWIQDTLLAGDIGLPGNEKNWNEAKLWAASLNFAGYSDWRLPRTPGTTTNGATAEGELGDLYHSELGNLRNLDIFNMSDTHSNEFWTGTELDVSSVFIVNFGNFKRKYSYSYQQTCSPEDNRQTWAVREINDYGPGSEGDKGAIGTQGDTKITKTTEVIEEVEIVAVTADAEVVKKVETVADAVDIEVTEKSETVADTTEAEVTENVEIVTDTVGTEVAEATEPQGVQGFTRAKGEAKGDTIVLHILHENNIKIIDNGDCIKVFWKGQLRKNTEIVLCLYGIKDYKWEDERFWISFNKGCSIKCNEVVIDIPLNVMSQNRIQTIFKVESTPSNPSSWRNIVPDLYNRIFH